MSQDQFTDIENELSQFETEFEEASNTEQSNEINERIEEQSNISVDDDFSVEQNKKNEVENEEKFPPGSNDEKKAIIHVNFPYNSTSIKQTIMATNQRDYFLATNKELRLILGRQYYVPVDPDADSDNFENIKLFSDVSDKIEIRYVKDGFACLYPLISRVVLHDEQRLCILIGA